jgi:MFS family permease
LTIGVVFLLISLALFGLVPGLFGLIAGYLLIQIFSNVSQAALQGFLPDLAGTNWRGAASGIKGFMDLSGAFVGFIVIGQLLGDGQNNLALLAIGLTIFITYLLTILLIREPLHNGPVILDSVSLVATFQLDLHQNRPVAWLVISRFLFLLGTYGVGRFFLFYIAFRLGLAPDAAAEKAGTLLAGLTLITVLAAPPAGWAADRFGRTPIMLGGAAASAIGVLLLSLANSSGTILLFGGLMAVGSAAFAGANWAKTADLVPPGEAGRFFGLANFGTAGAAAAAGLFGPLVDLANSRSAGFGYTVLFLIAGVAFLASGMAVRRGQLTILEI